MFVTCLFENATKYFLVLLLSIKKEFKIDLIDSQINEIQLLHVIYGYVLREIPTFILRILISMSKFGKSFERHRGNIQKCMASTFFPFSLISYYFTLHFVCQF